MKLLKTFENFKENEIDIELEDFLGEKFKLRITRKSGTPLNLNHIYTQDEVEMVIEDFKLIADVHNLKLTNYHNYTDLNEELIYYEIYMLLNLDSEEICIALNSQIEPRLFQGRFIYNNILEDEDFLSDLDVFINQQKNIGLIVEIDFNIHSIIIKKNRNLKNIYLKDYKFIRENYNGIENIILKDYQGNSFNIIGNAYGHPLLPKERLPVDRYPMTFTKDEVEMIIEDFNVIANLHNLRMVDYSGRYVDTEDTYYIGVFFDFYQYKKYHICIEIETENYDEDLRSDIHSFITQQNNMGYSIDTESDENDNVWQILIFKKEENNPVMKHLESFKYILENESDEPDFNKVSIELTDLKGNKFELRSDRTLFDQDEVEMILEDFEVIPKLHNINLHSENHEYLYDDSDFYQFYRVCFAGSIYDSWGEYILFELYLDELPNDVEEDLYSFINKIKNYGFNTIYNRKECNENGDKYSYIHITIEKI